MGICVAAHRIAFMIFLQNYVKPRCQLEVACILTNIASGNQAETRAVAEHMQTMFTVLHQTPDGSVWDQIVWALGNILGDNADYREQCCSLNAIPVIVSAYEKNDDIEARDNAIWAMSNLCKIKGLTPQAKENVLQNLLPILTQNATSPFLYIVASNLVSIGHVYCSHYDFHRSFIGGGTLGGSSLSHFLSSTLVCVL